MHIDNMHINLSILYAIMPKMRLNHLKVSCSRLFLLTVTPKNKYYVDAD